MADDEADPFRHALLAGGDCGELIAERDWASTPLGPLERWPQSLRTATALLLRSPVPMVMLWGEAGVMIYNDPYSAFAGGRHPELLGSEVRLGWPEVADFNDNVMRVGLAGGTLSYKDQELTLYRHGPPEQVWMNLDYSPVVDESGRPAGVLCVLAETTQRVIAEREQRAAETVSAESEARFRALVNASSDVVYRMDPDWTEMRQLDGRGFLADAKEPLVKWLDVYLFDEDRPAVLAAAREAIRTRGVFELEHRVRRQDGSPGWIFSRAIPVEDSGGEVVEWFGMASDVTERHRAESALKELFERYRLAARATNDAIWDWRLDSGEVVWNQAIETLFGHSEAVDGTTAEWWLEHIHPNDRVRVDKSIHAVIDGTGEAWTEEYRFRRVDGSYATVLDRGTVLRDAKGRPVRVIGAMLDLTERKRAEARLHESETRYRTLFDSIESGFCVVEVDLEAGGGRIDYRVVEANPAFYRHTGFPETILGCWLREAIPALEEHWYDVYGRVARTGEAMRFEQGSDMLGRWFDVYAFRIDEPVDRRVAILFNDISARRQVELALKESEARHRLALEAGDLGTWSYQPISGALAWDGRCKALFGLPEDAEVDFDTFLAGCHPDDRERMTAAVEAAIDAAGSGLLIDEYRTVGLADGVERWLATRGQASFEDGRCTGLIGVVLDISEQKRAEATLRGRNKGLERRVAEEVAERTKAEDALRQAQKMEAMGQLTGGVAHDFNNLLTPIVGSLDILQRKGLGGEREQRLVAGAMQSAERAKLLVQRLLAFARRQPLEATAVDVGALVHGMGDLIGSTSGPRIRLELEIEPELPPALADANQIEMAILNLAVNARDAMPDGGTLTLAATAEPVTEGHRSGLAPGRYVRLAVSDTGHGMDEETRARAIEPFFSTKGVGKGTGLGLSMVHGLAAQLGGALTIESRPKLGTHIELWLPIAARKAEADPPRPDDEAGPAAGTVLLVDDEELVRASTSAMLGDLGYRVVEASSGEEAMQQLREGLSPDLLVTDHLMPGISGADLVQLAWERLPGLPVLVVSGYAEDSGIAPGLPRLTKPFRQNDLADAIGKLGSG